MRLSSLVRTVFPGLGNSVVQPKLRRMTAVANQGELTVTCKHEVQSSGAKHGPSVLSVQSSSDRAEGCFETKSSRTVRLLFQM